MNTTTATPRSPVAPDRVPTGNDRLHLSLAAALMLVCLAIAFWITPTKFWSDVTGEPNIEAIVPKSFGDWTLSPYGANTVVNPQQEEALRTIYTSTVARAYVHKVTGRQILLSVAYGKDQTRDTQLHPPEACYQSQGFRVNRLVAQDIQAAGFLLPAMRMDTEMGPRTEYVTYFVRVGEELARGSLQRNLIRMQYAAKGYIADGLLFRVSEVTRGRAADSYAVQDDFLRSLLGSVPKASVLGLVGKQQAS